MGWQIMGTEHLGGNAIHLSDEELTDRVIDWLEDNGMTLQPWQATALRAILIIRCPKAGMVQEFRNGRWVWRSTQCHCSVHGRRH